ncbi:B3/B4 domain-containing protein [Archangium sp.]|uniref:B3/B4 domain-containing protein n=1 Tax=Archangium sp. TaxID=1872627 RepID=UPI002D4EC4FF|nr:phenylalanine--tRNA ligase beta subunit-related protein [Archangium sp.]HYO54813.1 phenylalanine--tRNA ligase beta subunit-related protein [Archangium sp.]
MKFIISDEMAQRYPDLRISILTVRGMDNTGESGVLQAELCEAEQRLRGQFADAAALGGDRRIRAWREAYRSFNVNPNKFKPSAEALLRRVVKGEPIPWISKAVNAYLLAELFYLLPVGGYDMSGVQGDIYLRLSPGGEPFRAIGTAEPEPTDAGEVVYADNKKILTRRWNFRDCDQAKLTPESKDIALFVEATAADIRTDELTDLAEFIAQKIQQYCGGTTHIGLLDIKAVRSMDIL